MKTTKWADARKKDKTLKKKKKQLLGPHFKGIILDIFIGSCSQSDLLTPVSVTTSLPFILCNTILFNI